MAIQHQVLNASFDTPRSTNEFDQNTTLQILIPENQLTETTMKQPQIKHGSPLSEFLTADELARLEKMQNSPPLEMHLPHECCQCAKRESHSESSQLTQDSALQRRLQKNFDQLTAELPKRTSSTFGGLDK